MSDDDPKPRITFRRAEEEPPLRDKDNADLHPQPHFPHNPPPNLAPTGMMGIRASARRASPAPERAEKGPDIRLEAPRHPDDLWTEGRMLSMPGYSFTAKLLPDPSPEALNGGTIAAFEMRKDGAVVALYEGGWKREPETPEAIYATRTMTDLLDPQPEKEFKALVPPDPERSHDPER